MGIRLIVVDRLAVGKSSDMSGAAGNRPLVGIGVIICRNRESVLVGRRKNSLGEGEIALPGGHLEFGETFEACAIREVKEETGLDLRNCRKKEVIGHVIHGIKHYVTIYMAGEVDEGAEPQTMEPDKCEGWIWANWKDLPKPLFPPLEDLVSSGFNPFD